MLNYYIMSNEDIRREIETEVRAAIEQVKTMNEDNYKNILHDVKTKMYEVEALVNKME